LAAADRWYGRLPGRFPPQFGRDLRSVPRYLTRYTVLVLASYGLFSLWDGYGDGHIPMVLPLRHLDPACHSSLGCAAEHASDAARWCGLTPVLAILDEVNPTVAAWVRRQHEQGTLVFSDSFCGRHESRGAMAKYDFFDGRLILYRAIFDENDGTAAAILCHEFRHSRQNPAKVFRYALSHLFATEGDASIVENDAELYEHEAHVAIFGR
jgi:hypothetical protein